MRAIVLVIILSSGMMALAQQSAPGLPNPDQLFQPPPSHSLNHPQFKWQIPNGSNEQFPLPGHVLVQPPGPTIDRDIDKGMVIHPPRGSFANQQPRSAPSSNLYPDLKILPTELAQLASGPSPWPKVRGIPIPITWPNAKLEPIPITWENFKMVPVDTDLAKAQSNARK